MTGTVAEEVWAFIETEGRDNRLHPTAVSMAAEAQRLGRRLKRPPCGVVLGPLDDEAAQELAAQGLEKIYQVDPGPDPSTPETRAQALSALWRRQRPGHLVFAASARGADLAARVALQVKCALVPQVVDYEGRKGEPLVLRTSVYGNRAHRRMELSGDRPWILSLYPPSLSPGRPRASDDMERVPVIPDTAGDTAPFRLDFEETQSIAPADLDVREARIVVGVGRGVGNDENLSMVKKFAERLGATVGGSRVAVEMGLIPLDRQIGLSGKRLQADVYVACGISGASHHLSGLQDVKHLVAINRDPAAPLMRMADLALVGDLKDILPQLIEQLDHKPEGGRPS
ncbi:MAG: electron transfer flavoprotein subunit alpha/FixB family protein [Rhodospirillales bacterium]|nr:electron transfer flavoprotein subunit alpha/FixB family protein [Rhodospirillales bacterium]